MTQADIFYGNLKGNIFFGILGWTTGRILLVFAAQVYYFAAKQNSAAKLSDQFSKTCGDNS